MGCQVTEEGGVGDEGKNKAVTLNSSGINPVASVCVVAQCEEPEGHWNSKTCPKEKLSWLKSLERVIYDKELNTTKAEEKLNETANKYPVS